MKQKQAMMAQLQQYYSLWREANAVYEEWAKVQGMSLNSVWALYSLHDEAECTATSISKRWMIPKQTVHTLLKDFEKRGYTELAPIPTDKRNKRLCLTSAGKAVADAIVEKLHSVELYAMERMGLEQMKALNDNLAVFLKLFQEGSTSGNV